MPQVTDQVIVPHFGSIPTTRRSRKRSRTVPPRAYSGKRAAATARRFSAQPSDEVARYVSFQGQGWGKTICLDLYSVENWSVTGDLQIMWHRFNVMTQTEGAN